MKIVCDICSISISAAFYHNSGEFPYIAEIVRSTSGIEILQYHGQQFLKHGVTKTARWWRCSMHATGCRVRLISRIVDGYVMVNKHPKDIIHSDHKGKRMKQYDIPRLETMQWTSD